MDFLREPIIWFLVIALTSTFITVVLFKVIKSSARIGKTASSRNQKRGQKTTLTQQPNMFPKEYLVTGGVAGFLFIFFASWYTFTPMLRVPVGQLAPTSIPDGYKPYSEAAFAFAIPNYTLPPTKKTESRFENQSGDSHVWASVIDNIPLDRFSAFNPDEVFPDKIREGFNKMFPGFNFTGPFQNAPVQGRRGYIWPVEVKIPDDPLFEDERGKNTKSIMHIILDDRSRKMLIFLYEDTEEAKKIMSTLTLPNSL